MTVPSLAHCSTPRDQARHSVPEPGRTPENTHGNESIPEHFTQRIAALGHILQVRIDQALSSEGITARQFDALAHIAMGPELYRASLAWILHTRPQAAAGRTARSRRAGEAVHRPVEPITFALTEAGARCLARARPIVAAEERDVLGPCPTSLPRSCAKAASSSYRTSTGSTARESWSTGAGPIAR